MLITNKRSKLVLDVLTQNSHGLGFNQIERLTKINRSTLSKILKNLVLRGDVMKWALPNKRSIYVLYDHREYLHCYCAYIDQLFDELENFSKIYKGKVRNQMVIATLHQVSKIWGRVMNEFLCHSAGWNNYNVLHKRIGMRLADWVNKYGASRNKDEKIDQFWEGAIFFQALGFEEFIKAESKKFHKHPW